MALAFNRPFKIEGFGNRLFSVARAGIVEYPDNEAKKTLLAGGQVGSADGSKITTLSEVEVSQMAGEIKENAQGRFAGFRNDTGIGPSSARFETEEGKSLLGGSSFGGEVDFSALEESEAFKALSEDMQKMVRSVYESVATNDAKGASELVQALKAAENFNDPYFSSLVRLASDAIARGYVSLEQEEAFKEQQLRSALDDLREDIADRSEFLTLEMQNALRGIDRAYEQQLDTTRQNLAATGFTQSTRRAEKEQLLTDERGDLVESTNRKFAFEQDRLTTQGERGERDIAAEIERLQRLAEEGRLDLLREAEQQLGSGNLGELTPLLGEDILGGVPGEIERQKNAENLRLAQSFVF